jgi:hypothetical protein
MNPIISKYTPIFIIPAIFSSVFGSIVVGGYNLSEPKTRSFFSFTSGVFTGGIYGLTIGGLWPFSISYFICKEINEFFKKQIQ